MAKGPETPEFNEPIKNLKAEIKAQSDINVQADVKEQVHVKDEGKAAITPPRQPASIIKPLMLSDRPLKDAGSDSLGFFGYVRAITKFLRAKETQPPLTVAITAKWGRGKTSFMNLLDTELHNVGKTDQLKFATHWFNPWKYSSEDQVWSAFVSEVTTCIRGSLSWWNRIIFEVKRFISNLNTRFTIGQLFQFIILVSVGFIFFWIVFNPDMEKFTLALIEKYLSKEIKTSIVDSSLGTFVPLLGGAILLYQLYFKVVKKFNISLIDFVKAKNFRDKIGTLTQFEEEMRTLNDCIPKHIKVVIFIDDLDRCKPPILWEIIEALQLADVSQRCIFILGMDMDIVVRTLEAYNPDLYPEISRMATNEEDMFKHKRGYQFLEKIIQARLSVPSYAETKMRDFVGKFVGTEAEAEALHTASSFDEEIPEDSKEVKDIISDYGPIYFTNPRRLKRFINGFRMHVYLAQMTNFSIRIEMLARFIILTEQKPWLVAVLRNYPDLLGPNGIERPDIFEDSKLTNDERILIVKSIKEDPKIKSLLADMTKDNFLELCSWYGFQYYH